MIAALALQSLSGLAPSPGSTWGFDRTALQHARYFTQKVDHFGASGETWQQAYFLNDEYSKGGPVFLYIGGEGPLSAFSVVSNFIVDWLPKVEGALFAVEHRCMLRNPSNPGLMPRHIRIRG